MKKLIALVCIVSVLAMGCMPTTMTEKLEKEQANSSGQGEVEKGTIIYDNLEDLDFSSGHINGVLRENFIIDADVPVDAPTECGTYEFSRIEVDKTREEYGNWLGELVNDYYKEDISVVDDGKVVIGEAVPNVYHDGNMISFSMIGYNESNPYHGSLKKLERYFYESGLGYDKELIDGVVERFMENFAELIPDGMNGDYKCYHIDEEFYTYLEEKYSNDIVDSFFGRDDIEYYVVKMYTEIEEGIYFEALCGFPYKSIKGEVLDEVTYVDGQGLVQCHDPQYLELVVSEGGEIISCRIGNYYNINEKIDTHTIISAKEALELFCKEFDGILLEDELIVKAIALEYMVKVEDELDENGYRNAYLIPIWRVRYDSEKEYFGYYQENAFFSAIDGERLAKGSGY